MKGKLNGMAWAQACGKLLQKYKYVLLVILAGVVLLLLPRSGENDTAPQEAAGTAAAVQEFDLEAMERKLEEALSRIDGAGEVHVVLTIKSGTRQILAQDSSRSDFDSSTETVVVSRGSGVEDTVVLQQIPPQYQGALVVCQGGEDAAVRLEIAQAVSALTGLGADRISICKSK